MTRGSALPRVALSRSSAYLLALVAIVTCPCHLPVLALLLGGTAAGALLNEHITLALAFSTLLFALAVIAAVRAFRRIDSTR